MGTTELDELRLRTILLGPRGCYPKHVGGFGAESISRPTWTMDEEGKYHPKSGGMNRGWKVDKHKYT